MEFDFLPQKIEGITSRQKWGLIFSNSIVVIIKVTKDKVSSNTPSDMHTWDLWRRQNYFAYFLQNYDKVKVLEKAPRFVPSSTFCLTLLLTYKWKMGQIVVAFSECTYK